MIKEALLATNIAMSPFVDGDPCTKMECTDNQQGTLMALSDSLGLLPGNVMAIDMPDKKWLQVEREDAHDTHVFIIDERGDIKECLLMGPAQAICKREFENGPEAVREIRKNIQLMTHEQEL